MNFLADSISRIKGGIKLKQNIIQLNYSKFILNFVQLLHIEGYIRSFKIYKKITKKNIYKKQIEINLAYDQNQNSIIQELNLLSKPGNRLYMSNKQLKALVFKKLHLNVYFISTSFGLISHVNAIKLNIGGEVICKIR